MRLFIRSLLPSALLCVLSFSESFAQKSYTIKGKVKGVTSGKIYLSQFVSNGTRDSAELKNGQFRFNGTMENAHPFVISLASNRSKNFLFFADHNATTTLSIDTANLDGTVVKGSKSDKDFRAYNEFLKPASDQLTALYEFSRTIPRDDQQRQDSINKLRKQAADERVALAKQFIENHPSSIISAYAITRYFSFQPDLPELKKLYQGLAPDIQQTTFGKQVSERIDLETKTGIGATAMNFTQNDTSGNPVSLSDFRGKYVLIDFWASWCGPCRAENPNLVAAFNQYKDKNFTVLGVSLDREGQKQAWLNAIYKDELTWTHVSDLKFWNNEAAKIYGVNAIPANFLIDPNGKIIERNLHGEKLKEALEKHLH